MASSLFYLSSSSSSFLSSAKPQKPFFSQRKRQTHYFTRPLTVKSVFAPETDTSLSAVQSFWQWLCDKGVVSSNSSSVKPGIVPEGIGLIAQKNISRNEVIFEVPKKLWINPDTVLASEIGKVCGGLKPWITVALFLIREKSMKDSSWRSYIDILPESTNSTMYWSEEELSELQGTQLLSSTLGVKEYVRSEFLKVEEEVIRPHKNLFPSITVDDFQWAFGILRSRAFSRLRGENLVLIPLADLSKPREINFALTCLKHQKTINLRLTCIVQQLDEDVELCFHLSQLNHSSSITTEDTAWEIKGGGLFSRNILFSLRSPISVKSGEQVYIQYDLGKSNAEFALDYGFIESRSDRNIYTLTLSITDSDPFFGDKLDIAESNGLGESASFDFVLGQSLPTAMLPYLRLVALGGTDAFLLESVFRNSVWGHLELPLSRANEELICRVVRDTCKAALSGYKTTIEEDEKLLEGGNLEPRLKIAVGVRIGEKKVLEQIDEIFRNREIELDELEYYQERRLKDLGLAGDQEDIIFWEPK